jgi:hypothetical protein
MVNRLLPGPPEEEGVRDPDKVVGELAEHYRSAEESGRASRGRGRNPG